MKPNDIAQARLQNQQLTAHKFTSPKELVHWMGAMQAQDYFMVKWAIGMRANCKTQDVSRAIENGEILRTHVLRPTWHIVAAEDLHWMLELTASRLKNSLNGRHRELGLDSKTLDQSNKIIEEALKDGKHLTRKELAEELESHGISPKAQRAAHILFWAELNGLICSGPDKGKNHSYALLEDRTPKPKKINKEDALRLLAERYFTSHGPATLQDFIWWSGLTVADAKNGYEAVKEDFQEEKIEEKTYLFSKSLTFDKEADSVFLLPAYDEYLISYKDRSASLPPVHFHKAVSNNGIFWAIVLINGKVAGTWKRKPGKEHINIELNFFAPGFPKMTKKMKGSLEKAATDFGEFLGEKVELRV